MFKSIKNIIEHHGKHFLTFTFFAGFLIDWFALPDISNPLYPYIGLFYGSIVAIGILAREWQLHRLSIGLGRRFYMSLSDISVSFALGSLLSYVFIYYVRSGDMFSSWPLYALLLISVFINEKSFQHSTKVLIDTGFLFIGVIFYIIFNTPLFYHQVSDSVFARSIIFGSLVCYLYAGLLALVVYNKRLASRGYLLAIIMPLVVAAFYFTNSIPAVPLTLRDGALYAKVSRNPSGNYDFEEIQKNPQKLFGFGAKEQVFVSQESPVYYYSAVLAPAEVKSQISHAFERYDTSTKTWQEQERITFPIVGGRKGGYRGYSKLDNATNGLYRVRVIVGENRVVGQKVFIVQNL